MERHILVVVDRDATVHRIIASAIRADQFDVVPCTTARGGLNASAALEPACVVAELELGTPDGYWLARAIRGQGGALGSTPLVAVSSSFSEDTQVRALQVGFDFCMPKPFHELELVAQVRALVEMASRVRRRARESRIPRAELPRGTRKPHGAIAGDLARMSVTTVLTALELEARTGVLCLYDRDGLVPLKMFVAGGALVGAQLGTRQLGPLDALIEALHWTGRSFEFSPQTATDSPPDSRPMGKLILLALQRTGEIEPAAPIGPQTVPTKPKRVASGTRRKVLTPTENVSLSEPVVAPGRRLVESIAPSNRPDPRAEIDDDADTDRLETA